ncbi:MAG: TolC family protein [Paludisphaera borealis]|uniref:TolC family protein n=1 Tax=Paludisphaera borealis TaxID=1387353 RepID=UPI0028449B08|nr:TolC family protein [Paludisphaera borealis]MDR3623420.1 TolC family protein [Paludisphaera borealis]
MMILVAITAVAAWGFAMKRRRDVAVLDHARATDRLQWAETMYKKGYVSKAQLVDAQSQFERTKHQLGY